MAKTATAANQNPLPPVPTVTDKVPLPDSASRYPFATMHKGDSFFVAWHQGTTQPVLFAITRWKKRHPGTNFKTHKVSEGGIVGIRVWMTEEAPKKPKAR